MTQSARLSKKSFILLSLALLSCPAYALFAKLSTELVAQYSLGGQTPKGKAGINQASYPSKPAVLSISVSSVNVPDGTVLQVNLSDCATYGAVAYLNIVGKSASLSASLPANCQIGRLSSISVLTTNGAVLLKGGAPWKI
jgi:hypothetical protein